MTPATYEDCGAVMAVHAAMRGKAAGVFMKYADDEAIFHYLRFAVDSGCAVLVDGYFVLYTVTPLWYTRAKFLIEELVIRIYPTNEPPTVAISALLELRDLFGCVAVVSGDAQAGAMAKHYLSCGFEPLGSQFIHTGAPTI